jgi:hypothetical protein
LVAWLNFAAPAHIQTRTVLIEAAENGWWYSAPVPEGRLVVAYMTDADQLDRALISNTETFLRFVSTAPLTSARVADGVPVTPPRAWLSESAITLPCVGEEWIAAGESPELARATHLEYADLDSGHWPMATRPRELARVLAKAATS